MNDFTCALEIVFFLTDRFALGLVVFFLLYVFFMFKPPPKSPVIPGLGNRHRWFPPHHPMSTERCLA